MATSLDQPTNSAKSNLRSHSQLILGNGGRHQQPTRAAEAQTTNTKQRDDCALW
jgi:hypothetical protein